MPWAYHSHGAQPLGLHEDRDGVPCPQSAPPCPRWTGNSARRCRGWRPRYMGARCEVVQNDAMGLRRGVGQIAQRAVFQVPPGRSGRRTARWDRRPYWGSIREKSMVRPSTPRGRAGLEPADGEAPAFRRAFAVSAVGGHQPLRAARPRAFADDDAAVQIHAAADHHSAAVRPGNRWWSRTPVTRPFSTRICTNLRLPYFQNEVFAVIHRPAHAQPDRRFLSA